MGYWQSLSHWGTGMSNGSSNDLIGLCIPSVKPGMAGPSSTLPASVEAPTTPEQVVPGVPSVV